MLSARDSVGSGEEISQVTEVRGYLEVVNSCSDRDKISLINTNYCQADFTTPEVTS